MSIYYYKILFWKLWVSNKILETVYYPILYIKRRTFKYRLDEQFVFDKFHLNQEKIFYIDEEYITEEEIKK